MNLEVAVDRPVAAVDKGPRASVATINESIVEIAGDRQRKEKGEAEQNRRETDGHECPLAIAATKPARRTRVSFMGASTANSAGMLPESSRSQWLVYLVSRTVDVTALFPDARV